MTEKKDKTKVEYGELNQLYDNKDVHEGINLDNENFVSLSRKTIKNNFVNTKMNQGRLVGFVLQIKEPEKSEGIFGSLFSTPVWKAYIRIPELDAHLPEPALIGEAARRSKDKDMGELSSQEVIEMHDIYAPKSPADMKEPKPGNKVWVTNSNGKPVILEVIEDKSGANNVDIEGAAKPDPKRAYKGGSGGYSGGTGGGGYSPGYSSLPRAVLKGEKLTNAKLIIQSVLDLGATEKEAANIVAMCQGESGLKPITEGCYTKTSAKRIRAAMGGRVKGKTDEELEVLKKDCVAFFDYCYRGPVGSEWYNKNPKDGARGGYKYRGRGFHQATGYDHYIRCGKGIKEDLKNKPELLEQAPIAAKALAWFYFKAWTNGKRTKLRGRDIDYSRFLDIYSMTWGGWADTQKNAAVREHRMKDVEKRAKWAEGWLEYIRRNITKTLPPLPPAGSYSLASGGRQSRQDIAQSEQLKIYLDTYYGNVSSLESQAILTASERSNGPGNEPQVDASELSKLIQFPIFNGQNMITPIQGVPGKIGTAGFDQPRGIYQHASYDQFVQEGRYKVRAMADATAYVSPQSANFDRTQKLFQGKVKQYLTNRNAQPFREAHAKRKISGIDGLAQRIENGQISTSNLGSMSWQQFRAWGKANMTNNALASLLRHDPALGLPSGGMGVTFTTAPDHNGLVYKYYYGHLNELYVTSGQSVKMGQVVGVAGSTSIFDSLPHLHFQINGPHDAPYYKKKDIKGNLKLRMPPSALVPSFAKNAKYEPIYSSGGAYASYQKSKLPPDVVSTYAPQEHNFEELPEYTENRVYIRDFSAITDSNDPRLVEIPTIPGRAKQKLHVLAAIRFMGLQIAAMEAGFPEPLAASGWRRKTYATREQYNAAMIANYGSVAEGRKWVAYQSPHMTGLAVDFGNNGLYPRSATNRQQKQTPFFKWLVKNAHKFGFTPYKREAWHWEVKIPKESYASGDEFTSNFQVRVTV